MPKRVERTPLEQAVAEQTDRRLRFDKGMRDKGFIRTSVWVPADVADDYRLLAKLLGATNGKLRDALKRLVHEEPAE